MGSKVVKWCDRCQQDTEHPSPPTVTPWITYYYWGCDFNVKAALEDPAAHQITPLKDFRTAELCTKCIKGADALMMQYVKNEPISIKKGKE